MSGLHFHPLRVRDVSLDTDDAVVVGFDVPDDLRERFAFHPGQYLTVRRVLDGADLRRSYSICSAAGEGLRVGVRRVPGGAFSTWLHQVTLNLCRDRLRVRRESLPLEAVGEAVDEDTPERLQGRADRSAQVRAAVQSLPERQREALLLCHYQGMGNIEAAQVMQLSVDALESLLARARRALRLALCGGRGDETGVGA